MRIVNLTKCEINLPVRGLNNLQPNTVSPNVTMTRDIIKSYLVPLANIHQDKFIVIVTNDERYMFNDIFSVFPLLNLRNPDDLVVYNKGDEKPLGSYVVTDNNYINPETGTPGSKDYLLLPLNTIENNKSGWEDPANPGSSESTVRFFEITLDEYETLTPKLTNALYFIYDKRWVAKGETIYTSIQDINDLKSVVLTELADLGMTDNTLPTSKAVVDYINHRFDIAISGVEYRGLIDANQPTDNEYWLNALHGYMFRVSVAGEIDDIELGIGDTIIINKTVTGVPTKDDMDVIPYTLDEIGDLKLLNTTSKDDLVTAVNEVQAGLPFWEGIDK